jgi:hypothetical protein
MSVVESEVWRFSATLLKYTRKSACFFDFVIKPKLAACNSSWRRAEIFSAKSFVSLLYRLSISVLGFE